MRWILLFLLLLLCGCNDCPNTGLGLGSTCGQTGNETSTTNPSGSSADGSGTTPAGTGQLYVANSGAASIERFASATTITGNIVPTVTLQGTLTRLAAPAYLTLDVGNDRLYVPNPGDNSILIFDKVSTLSANTAPTRFIQGTGTNLNNPVQVQLDPARNELYVANAGSSSILVFANATTAQGIVAPLRTLQNTALTGLDSIALDTANNRLYALTGNAIAVFDNMSTLNGNIPPSRTVSGGNTKLNAATYLLLDGVRAYVSNAGDASILRFESVSSLSGNVAPTAQVQGSTASLVHPGQLALDGSSNELFVADPGASAVFVIPGASTASGSPAITRKIVGSNTGFSGVSGIALDLTR